MSFDVNTFYITEPLGKATVIELKNYPLVNLSVHLLGNVPFSFIMTDKIALDFKETKLVEGSVWGLWYSMAAHNAWERKDEPNFLYELKKADKERDLLVDFRYKSGIRRLYAKKILEYVRTL